MYPMAGLIQQKSIQQRHVNVKMVHVCDKVKTSKNNRQDVAKPLHHMDIHAKQMFPFGYDRLSFTTNLASAL